MHAIETLKTIFALVREHLLTTHGEGNDTALLDRIQRDVEALSHRANIKISAEPVTIAKAPEAKEE